MEGVKKNATLDGAGIICLTSGLALLEKGDTLSAVVLLLVGAALLALKYYLR